MFMKQIHEITGQAGFKKLKSQTKHLNHLVQIKRQHPGLTNEANVEVPKIAVP